MKILYKVMMPGVKLSEPKSTNSLEIWRVRKVRPVRFQRMRQARAGWLLIVFEKAMHEDDGDSPIV